MICHDFILEAHPFFRSFSSLISFRGLILSRDTVSSNDLVKLECPSLLSNQLFVPFSGRIPIARAADLSLGFYYLGRRRIVLTIRDVITKDTVKVYLDFSSRTYPMGLLPGAVVTLRHLKQHVSRQGMILFCWFVLAIL